MLSHGASSAAVAAAASPKNRNVFGAKEIKLPNPKEIKETVWLPENPRVALVEVKLRLRSISGWFQLVFGNNSHQFTDTNEVE